LIKKLFLLFSPPKNSDWGASFGYSPAPCPHIVLATKAKQQQHLSWTTNPQIFGPGSEQLDHSGYNYSYPPY
jgi:hypothetical protein